MTDNDFQNKGTVKVVRQQLHEIAELNRKYTDIASNYRDTLNSFADLKIMNTQLRGENKKLKVLLQVATKEIQEQREKILEDLRYIFTPDVHYPTVKDKVLYYIKRWEGK